MNEQRASRSDSNNYGHWLSRLVEPLRQLVSGRTPEGSSLRPVTAGPRLSRRGPIVQHTRAGDVYRL
jgi:hypothetical protein